jgi:hypothetical protein
VSQNSGDRARLSASASMPAYFLGPLKALHARRPGQTSYVVLDNFSPTHAHARVRAWAAERRRAGLPADLRFPTERDRGRLHSPALLRARLTDPITDGIPGQSRLTSRQSTWALIRTVACRSASRTSGGHTARR